MLVSTDLDCTLAVPLLSIVACNGEMWFCSQSFLLRTPLQKDNNDFTGKIPPEIGELRQLTHLNLCTYTTRKPELSLYVESSSNLQPISSRAQSF